MQHQRLSSRTSPRLLHRLRRIGLAIVLAVFPSIGLAVKEVGATVSRPHLPRQGANLVPNATVATRARWSLLGDAKYDGGTSRSHDGSGAFLLTTSAVEPKGSKVYSDFIPVIGGKIFTYAFYIKTAG